MKLEYTKLMEAIDITFKQVLMAVMNIDKGEGYKNECHGFF